MDNNILKEKWKLVETTHTGQVWFRGTSELPKNIKIKSQSQYAYYTGATPQPIKQEVPPIVEQLYNDGKIETIYYAYPYGTEWKIPRKYTGMSNFGFGVYFANSLDWAERYGEYITVALINPEFILNINWNERDIENTTAHRLMTKVRSLGGINIRDQASVFYRSVKSIDKTKKALFVQVDEDEGQLAVYDPSIIKVSCVIEMRNNKG